MDNTTWYDNTQEPDNRENRESEILRERNEAGILKNVKKQRRAFSLGTVFACMLITALLAGSAGGLIVHFTQNKESTVTEAAADSGIVPSSEASETEKPSAKMLAADPNDSEKDMENAAAPASNTVVFIRTEQQGMNYYGQQETAVGRGSGVIITSDGYIATNNHVVSGAAKITVILTDGREFEAELIGSDPITDLAVVKIGAANLKPAVLGSSSAVTVGDEALAIGNPLGELTSTVTKGIISAIDREITVEGQQMTLLQTDAAINPGNSGGGLFNTKGELIGIVNAKSMALEVEGLGYAIPIDTAKTVLADLMDKGFVSGRPYLGVNLQDVMFVADGDRPGFEFGPFGFFDRQQYVTRVQIMSVQENSAADSAGLRENDFILKLNDTVIANSSHFTSLINEYAAGDVVTLTVQRGNRTEEISVTLGERNAS